MKPFRHTVAGFVSVAFIMMFGSIYTVVNASSATPKSATTPICESSRIIVSIGKNLTPSPQYPNAVKLVPVLFKNVGATCQFRKNGPAVVAIVNPKASQSSIEESFPADTQYSHHGKEVIVHGDQVVAIYEVIKPIGFTCIRKTTTELAVSGYALPVGSEKTFQRAIKGVCVNRGTGVDTDNTEIVWPTS